ncbi:MAG TPA: GvpL/GvpF family gas vesicle protein, partial [Candidatus Hypogeohydataceae bacterium YC38]
ISAQGEAQLPEGLWGLEEAPLYILSLNGTGAVVSNINKDKIRPQREYVLAHNGVVHRMSQVTTFLPASIGNMAPSRQKVDRMLRLNGHRFQEELERLEGKTEMGLKVFWEVENIYQYLTSVHRELAEYRDSIYGNPGGPSHQEKMALGEMFGAVLERDREDHTMGVMDILGPYCHEIVEAEEPYGEKMVMNLACLVDKDLKRYEQGIEAVARDFDENFSLVPSGPFAPYNFIRIPVSLD